MKSSILDASTQSLGRLAAKAAHILMGKDRPTFERHVKKAASVAVINTDGLLLTGRKLKQKIYYRHSGYLGNLKEISAERMKKIDSRRIIRKAVMGMLPKNKLRDKIIKNLKIYKGSVRVVEK